MNGNGCNLITRSYLGAMIEFKVGLSMIYSIFYGKHLALMKFLFLAELPTSWDSLQKFSFGFKYCKKRVSPSTSGEGALPGTALHIKKPKCQPTASYNCRKGYYALPGFVDSNYRFVDASVCCVSSTNKYQAHSLWSLEKCFVRNKLLLEF